MGCMCPFPSLCIRLTGAFFFPLSALTLGEGGKGIGWQADFRACQAKGRQDRCQERPINAQRLCVSRPASTLPFREGAKRRT